METTKQEFSFVPNYKTLVSAGHSHFSRVADALAEFIDNSIQACQGQKDIRKIDIGLDLNFHGDAESYISILDNGEGMNAKTLADFAVYGLDKESRGLNPSSEIASNISKFGVGAKQAGFYLGTRIHVLTTTSGSSKILELILDKNEIEERSYNDEDVYKGHISSHDVLPLASTEPKDANNVVNFGTDGQFNCRIQNLVNELIEKKIHVTNDRDQGQFELSFTLIAVRLRKGIKRKLHREESYKNLPTQLADIYHFHLHPENLPNAVASRIFEQVGQDQDLVHTKAIVNRCKEGHDKKFLAPLDISFQIVENGHVSYLPMPLQHLDDINSRYFKHMKHSFRFNLDLPDPDPPEQEKSKLQSQLDTDEGERKIVQGLILYFPSIGGQETLPSGQVFQHPIPVNASQGFKDKKSRVHSGLITIEDSSDDEELAAEKNKENFNSTISFQDIEDLTADSDDSLFRIYWQNRLVPDTKLSKLSFFPDAKTLVQCHKLRIPLAWCSRIKCFLFFDANFHNISNNKLKINVDPDLQSWITSKQVVQKTLSHPTNLNDRFLKWLKSCNDKFDQEYVYGNLYSGDVNHVIALYEKCVDIRRQEDTSNLHIFKELRFSASSGTKTLRIGDSVRINLSGSDVRKQRGETSGNRKKVVFGEILGFIKFCHVSPTMTEAFGQGLVWYKQIPEQVYGEEHIVNITCLDMAKIIVKKGELDDVVQNAPNVLKVEVYHRPHFARPPAISSKDSENGFDEDNKKVESFSKDNIENVSKRKSFNMYAAEPVDITVTVLSAMKKLVLHRPNDTSKMYAVRMYTKDTDFKKSDPQKSLYAKKVDGAHDAVSFVRYRGDAKAVEKNAVVHYFNKIQFNRTNESEVILFVDVIDGKRVVLSRKYLVKVTAGPVSQFNIQSDDFYDEKKPHVAMLGSFIPPFSLCFFDDGGNKSSAFRPPSSRHAPVATDGQSSGDEDGEEKNSLYWIRVSSRDDDIYVEAVNDESWSQEYQVPKENISSEIDIGPEIFMPLPWNEEEAVDEEESASREKHLLELLARAPSNPEAEDNQQWKSYGLRKPFISCVTTGRKVVFFDVTTNLCPGVTQSFSITFTPGYPSRICLLDYVSRDAKPHITVRNGEHLPPITVACFDSFNNRTDPAEGSEWNVRLVREGPVKSLGNEIGTFPVLKGGKCVLKNLIMNAEQLLTTDCSEGAFTEQTLELIWPAEEILSQISSYPQCKLKAVVLPGNRPERIEILRDSQLITNSTLSEVVGSLVTGLSVRILDEAGEEWENCEGWSVDVRGSWELNEGRTVRRSGMTQSHCLFDGSSSRLDALVDIKLPKVIECEANALDFSVTCTVEAPMVEKRLDAHFKIHLLAGEAVRWKINLSDVNWGRGGGRRRKSVDDTMSDLRVRCDDEEDLTAQIAGICAVDKFGNSANFGDSVNARPTLIVKWDDEPVSEQNFDVCLPQADSSTTNYQFNSTWTTRENRFKDTFGLALESDHEASSPHFVIQPSTSLRVENATFLPNTIISNKLSDTYRPFWLYCLDSKKMLSPSEAVQGMVISGIPVAVRLTRGPDMSIGVKELFDVPFTCKSQLTDLNVLLVDSCENVVNLKKLGDRVQDLTFKIKFDPSIETVDPQLAATGLDGDDAIVLDTKKIKPTQKVGRVPFKIDFNRVFTLLEEKQVLREGFLTDLTFLGSFIRVQNGHPTSKRKNSFQTHTMRSTGAVVLEGGEIVEHGNNSVEEKVHLDSARLSCCYRILDLVTSLDVQALVQNSNGVWEPTTEVVSGTPFKLQVILTSKESNFLNEPQLQDIGLDVKYCETAGRVGLTYNLVDDVGYFLQLGKICRPAGQDDSMERIIDYPSIADVTKRGTYTFKFVYTESRDHLICDSLRSMLSDKVLKVTQTFELVVQPGQGVRLLPVPCCEPLLHGHDKIAKTTRRENSRYGLMDDVAATFSSDLFVTDTESSEICERSLIAKGQYLDICFYDASGNEAILPHSGDHVCVAQVKYRRGHHNENHSQYFSTQEYKCDLRLPRLEGANEHGYVKGERVSASTYRFSHLALEKYVAQEGSEGADGKLNLVFSLLPTEQVDNCNCDRVKMEVSSFKVEFHYTSDETHAQHRRQLNQRLEPLLADAQRYSNSSTEKEAQFEETLEKISSLLSGCNDKELKEYYHSPSVLTRSDLEQFEARFGEIRKDIREANGTQHQARRAIKDEVQLVKPASNRGFVGHVVDLASVSTEQEARILSWAAGAKSSSSSSKSSSKRAAGGGYMKALVFVTEKDAKRALPRDTSSSYFRLDRIASGRKNNAYDVTDKIHLPDIVSSKGSNIGGNPQHMVNLLEMESGDHDLRGTVFFNIFMNKILIDTSEDAEKYIDLLLGEGVTNIPTIYTRDGFCYRGDGLVIPKDNIPAKLDFVFGEPRNNAFSYLENIEKDLEILDDVKSIVSLRDRVLDELQELEHLSAEVQREIERITGDNNSPIPQPNLAGSSSKRTRDDTKSKSIENGPRKRHCAQENSS